MFLGGKETKEDDDIGEDVAKEEIWLYNLSRTYSAVLINSARMQSNGIVSIISADDETETNNSGNAEKSADTDKGGKRQKNKSLSVFVPHLFSSVSCYRGRWLVPRH